MIGILRWTARLSLCSMVVAVGACNGGNPVESKFTPGETITATRGQTIEVFLGTVGPGEYDSIPAVSSPVIRFLDSGIVGPYVPAGARQRFRFVAQARGTAVVTFHHSEGDRQVVDEVKVR